MCEYKKKKEWLSSDDRDPFTKILNTYIGFHL